MTERDHLDPATIAALVDRTLEPAARAVAQAHLAACADCREVWVETSEMAGGTVVANTPRSLAARRAPRPWIYAGAAIAASVVVGLGIVMLRQQDHRRDPSLEALLGMTQGRRFTEAQTSLVLPWQPRPSPVRSDERSLPTRARTIAEALEREARSRKTAEGFHKAGLAALVTGRPAEATGLLETAAKLGSTGADLDLAAALLENCRAGCGDEEKLRALAAAERSLANAPDSAPALFNRALALEMLGRRDDAVRAWHDAQLRQADPGWRAEVAAHIERLRNGVNP